ncbi:hypothetical protein [Streptomyces sp. CC219B]|uniref:hypothetical protein n=1 Tax=Streptomyces sp. CC219B TaxID=3044574 RepID=UPI0024A974EE|nr:hypothetical protein [Streptomyces sp. CC219B]
MTDSAPPDDGEPTSLREKAKGWVEKGKGWAEEHPRTIGLAKAAAGMVAGAVAVAVLAQSGGTEDEDEISSVEASANAEDDAEGEGADSAESADSAEEKEKRNSPGKHNVAPHKRRLKDGREIDVSGYERGGSPEDGDEDPGEAAA